MNPAKNEEIADMTAEEITISSSSGSPPSSTVPNSTDISVSHDGSNVEGDITIEEESSEVNLENSSDMTTPSDLPSTSAERGNRSVVFIGQGLKNLFCMDPIIQKLTRQLFSTGEPNSQDLIDIQNALVPRELVEKIKKAKAANKASYDNPSPAGKGNRKQ